MPGTTPKGRTGQRQAQQPADDRTTSAPCSYAPDESGHYVGHGAPAVHSFVRHVLMRQIKAVLAMLAILTLLFLSTNHLEWCSLVRFSAPSTLVRRLPLNARATASSFLEVFQVYPPVLTVAPNGTLELTDGSSNATVKLVDSHKPTCQDVLAVHTFAFSYGKPFVGQYAPPKCTFNRVTWNLTVVSAGRQFDRLGIVYLGDVEVFRTSTAEPTADGIEWTYLKDMTNFLSLLQDDQKIIFDLGNLINDVYTASFNVTLTASYFTAKDSIVPADLILPVSARKGAEGQPSVFTVPPATASNALRLPKNTKKAVFTIAATGQSEEEFWWSNVLQSNIDTFPKSGELYGYSPFREVQLFIDGNLAGVAWPFPIIFTGGVVPGLWRPIVGIDAFDLKEDEIDITPWLPVLCDGRKHNFTIRVAGLVDNGKGHAELSETISSYWLVTGKVFIWLDESSHVTTGSALDMHVPPPTFDVSSTIIKSTNGTNETLLYEVKAERSLSISALIKTSQGVKVASWHQSLTFSNSGNFSSGGNVEINDQVTHAYDISANGYARQYTYPLYAFSVYHAHKDNITITAKVDRGKDVKILGEPAFPTGFESYSTVENFEARYPTYQGSWLSTTQSGDATYLANETAQTSYSYGTTEQTMTFQGVRADLSQNPQSFPPISVSDELFRRHVKAVNGTVVTDREVLAGVSIGHKHGTPPSRPGECAFMNSLPNGKKRNLGVEKDPMGPAFEVQSVIPRP